VTARALRDEIAAALAPVEAATHTRVAALEASVGEQLRALQGAVHKSNLAGWADVQGVAGLAARLGALEKRVEADGDTMEAALMSLSRTFDAALGELRGKAEGAAAAAADASAGLDALAADVAGLPQEVAALARQRAAADAALAGLQGERVDVAGLSRTLQGVRSELGALQAGAMLKAEHTAAFAKVAAKMSTMQARAPGVLGGFWGGFWGVGTKGVGSARGVWAPAALPSYPA